MRPAPQVTAYPAGQDQFRAMLGDRVIAVSDQPFAAVARVLLAERVDPATPIVTHYLGGYARSTVGAVAGSTVTRRVKPPA
jgi:hypothetical protein